MEGQRSSQRNKHACYFCRKHDKKFQVALKAKTCENLVSNDGVGHQNTKQVLKCNECTTGFVQNTPDQNHPRTHTCQAPSRPKVAFRESNHPTNFRRWIDVPKKSYQFVKEIGLMSHLIRRGSQFTCVVCHYVASCQFALDAHFFKHTKERPFACPECYKRFTLKRSIELHLKIHETVNDESNNE